MNNTLSEQQLGDLAENTMKTISFDPIGEPSLLRHARTCVGLSAKNNNAGFVNMMLMSCDLEQAPGNTPADFSEYGKECSPIKGAICIFEDYVHVGIIESVSPDNQIRIISYHEKTKTIEISDASDSGEIISCRRPSNYSL